MTKIKIFKSGSIEKFIEFEERINKWLEGKNVKSSEFQHNKYDMTIVFLYEGD